MIGLTVSFKISIEGNDEKLVGNGERFDRWSPLNFDGDIYRVTFPYKN
jgi:hypothetical protein